MNIILQKQFIHMQMEKIYTNIKKYLTSNEIYKILDYEYE